MVSSRTFSIFRDPGGMPGVEDFEKPYSVPNNQKYFSRVYSSIMSNPNPSPATRFRKGVSPNPGGKPKEFAIPKGADDDIPKIREYALAYLRQNPKEIKRMVKFLATDKSGMKLLWQMLEGKPREQAADPGGVNLSVIIEGPEECPKCGWKEPDDGESSEEPLTPQTAP